jgi:hypothetical protein
LKYKVLFAAAIIAAFFSGCATLQSSKNILEFTISPDKGIKAGSFVVVTVKTTEDVEKVNGYLDAMGSTKVPLKYNTVKKIWQFATAIPVTLQIPKGEFIVKVEATTKSGEKYVAEKKINTY